MLIKVIDSFDTMNPPDIDIKPTSTLKEDLHDVANQMVSVCKIKLRDEGEDMDLATLKEIAKVALDIQKAFFDNKAPAVQVNNMNVSNTTLNHFKGIMRTEI